MTHKTADDLEKAHALLSGHVSEGAEPTPLLAAATTLMRTRDYADALCAAKGAVALIPDDPRGWALMGLALKSLGRPHDAMPALRRSMILDERDPVTALALAELYEASGRIEDALALCNWLVLHRSTDPDASDALVAMRRRLSSREGLA